VLDRDLDVAEAVLLEEGSLPQRRLDERLRSRPALAISLTLSSNCLMLPGLTRTAAQPASIAAKTYFGWKWMSAITGICDFLAMVASASASSWVGQATRTIWQPDAVSSAICCRVAPMSDVLVVVIDCTETGASPPTATEPTWIFLLTLRSASFVGTDGIPREIAVICCATPRCGSRSRDRRAPAPEITALAFGRAHRTPMSTQR
jgi:hypothetical protein